ncbi:MAG: hypothetical protein ACXWJM_01045 [Ramlibacter sp.]
MTCQSLRLQLFRGGRLVILLAAAAWLAGCETTVRIPGLSFSFPESAPAFVGATHSPDAIAIAASTDGRAKYLGRNVAGTEWHACMVDTLPEGALPDLVHGRIVEALGNSRMFASVEPVAAPANWTLETEIQVFCSQTRGFVIRRVAGLVGIKFTLKKGGKTVSEQTVERVVTDADPEFTGAAVSTVEQAMRRAMADTLRVVLSDALRQMEKPVRDMSGEH